MARPKKLKATIDVDRSWKTIHDEIYKILAKLAVRSKPGAAHVRVYVAQDTVEAVVGLRKSCLRIIRAAEGIVSVKRKKDPSIIFRNEGEQGLEVERYRRALAYAELNLRPKKPCKCGTCVYCVVKEALL